MVFFLFKLSMCVCKLYFNWCDIWFLVFQWFHYQWRRKDSDFYFQHSIEKRKKRKKLLRMTIVKDRCQDNVVIKVKRNFWFSIRFSFIHSFTESDCQHNHSTTQLDSFIVVVVVLSLRKLDVVTFIFKKKKFSVNQNVYFSENKQTEKFFLNENLLTDKWIQMMMIFNEKIVVIIIIDDIIEPGIKEEKKLLIEWKTIITLIIKSTEKKQGKILVNHFFQWQHSCLIYLSFGFLKIYSE